MSNAFQMRRKHFGQREPGGRGVDRTARRAARAGGNPFPQWLGVGANLPENPGSLVVRAGARLRQRRSFLSSAARRFGASLSPAAAAFSYQPRAAASSRATPRPAS